MSDMNNPSDDNGSAVDDLWADALNEQKTTTSSKSTTESAPSIPQRAIFWLSVLRIVPPPTVFRFLYIIPYFVSHCKASICAIVQKL